MKLLKYTLFSLISLLLAVQAIAQPGTRRMNISIGIFSPSATSYDYEGAIGVVGSTGYTVDDIEPGDMFWDDLSRYQVDSVEVIVEGSSATVWVTDLYGAGAPQSGKGTLGKPSPNLGLQPMTENGSNFMTEAQEAKILTDNLNRMDSLAGDGNGIIDALPSGDVSVDAAGNKLVLSDLDSFVLDTSFVIQPQQTGSRVLMDINENELLFRANPLGIGGDFGIRMLATPAFRTISLGDFGNDFNEAAIGVTDHSTTSYLKGGYSCGIRATERVTIIGDYLKDSDETYIELDVNGDMTLSTFNNIFFRGDGWSYQWPSNDPGANQVLGEGAVDDDILEWVDLPAAGGNGVYGGSGSIPASTIASAPGDGETFYLRSTSGIIDIGNASGELIRIDNDTDDLTINSDNLEINTVSAVIGDIDGAGNSTKITVDDGSSNVKIGSTSNTWIQTAQGATSITASGAATGKIIASGASSLPSAISHIEGVDTSQITVRAAGGIGLSSTKFVDFQTDTLLFGGLVIDNPAPSILGMRNYAGRWDIQQAGSAGLLNIYGYNVTPGDPAGIFINGATGSVVIGDRDGDIHGSRVTIDASGYAAEAGYSIFLSSDGNTSLFGDAEDGNWGVSATDGLVQVGDFGVVSISVDADNELVNIGDVFDDGNSTKVIVDDGNSEIIVNADDGVSMAGAAYSYTLPVTTPTAADSLYRVMAWKQGVSSFQVMNGANYRTATASGNILPYDDYVEVDPDVTVHLPAPIAALKGKVFHIIAGGGTGGANPGTIDVVDGSSTIEVGSSLTLDTAFESYSLVCNGSVWIVLNNKP